MTRTAAPAGPVAVSEPEPAVAPVLPADPLIGLTLVTADLEAPAAAPGEGAVDVAPAPVPMPLGPAAQTAITAGLQADPAEFSLWTDARVDELLAARGAPAIVTGRTLLLPTSSSEPHTPEAIRLLLAAVRQALAGVDGPVDPGAPLTDPLREMPPPGAATGPPAPEGPLPIPEVPAPEAVPAPAPAARPADAVAEAAAPAPAPAEGAAAGEAAPAPDVPLPAVEGAPPVAAPVELLMPPAPAAPSPAQQARVQAVGGAAGGAAAAAKDLPSADATTASARAAVAEPAAESAARARAGLAAELGERPPPSPEIVALCERIMTAIRERRPVDEDALDKADPQKAAQEAGAGLTTAVGGEAAKVQGGYDELNQTPSGTPQQTAQPITAPAPGVAAPPINASSAAPDPVPPENVSLDADKAAVDQKVADANIQRPSTEPITSAPFSTVREGQAELGSLATTGPSQVELQQSQALATAQMGMADLQQKALAALQTSRAGTVQSVGGGQTAMVGSEEAQRTKVAADAQAIFDQAKTDVTALITPLGATAIARWDAGVAVLSTAFKAHLDTVKKWVDERHEGVGGAIVGVWDDVAGLPDWITDEYTSAERTFGEGVCELLTEISRDVNAVIAAAQAVIEGARTRIDKLFADLPEGLREWAEGERARFSGQLDGLTQQVDDARTSFVKDVSAKAVGAVAEVQAAVEQLREAAKGLIGKVYDAINAFLEDPVKAIIDALLMIVGIPPAAFWALVARIQSVAADIADDPVTFLNNLVATLRQGFQQFFDNFGTHVIAGFWKWLFSGLGKVGVTMPPDTSLGSLVSLALQIMGISWPRIRTILVKYIGEQNVALIEQAWKLVSTLITEGPAGIVKMLKDALDPAKIIGQIVSAAVEFLIEALIKQVVVRVIGLLNPAGAVLQAIELIYKVLKWVFENAARIFQLVESVVGGMADIMAGNIGGAAKAVENALASTIPIVIDFLAGLLGLGDLPEKIAGVIEKLQAYVLGIVDKVIGFLVTKAKALLSALGLGGEDPKTDAAGDKELGSDVSFSGGGESHRQWLNVTAAGATPMVASTEVPVAAKLKEWSGKLDATFKKDDPRHADAQGLIAAATGAFTTLDTQADALAAAYVTPKPGAPLPSDDPVEAQQRTLSSALGRLFELFGGDPEAFLKDIAAALPGQATARAKSVTASWWDRMADIKIGNQDGDPPLWASALTLAGSESTAVAYAGTAPVHQQLLPYFTVAPGERKADTAAFAAYAFSETAPKHTVRRDFHVTLANAVAGDLKNAGAGALAAATNVDPTYKDKLRGKIDAIAFSWTPDGGTWTLPTERVPDHTRYRPVSITEEQGGAVTKYTTVTGQTFTVTRAPDANLTTTVEGLGLRMMSGRGVTQDSPWFTSGQGFNRAHLIANEFGGSGYENGQNLATTSDEYNQKVMRGAELAIGASILKFALEHNIPKADVVFNLTVRVTFGALLDAQILAEIKQQDWYKAGDQPDLEAEIKAKINAGEVHKDLRRVTSVLYTWTIVTPPGESGALPPLEEDIWLLAK